MVSESVTIMIWSLLGFAIGSIEYSPLDPKPENYKNIPGCYISNLNKIIPVGKEITSPDCVLYRCQDNWMDFQTCNLTIAAPDCYTVSGPDATKSYPDCCPKIQCYA